MKQSADKLCKLGEVIGTHGLRGELKARVHPGDQTALLCTQEVHLATTAGEQGCFRLLGARPNKGNLLLRVAGVEHVNQAEALIGAEVLIDPAKLSREPGELFWFELEGARVMDRERGEIGRLRGMFVTAAHGVYVIEGKYGEVLLPAVNPFMCGFDAAEQVLNVDVPEGLYPETA